MKGEVQFVLRSRHKHRQLLTNECTRNHQEFQILIYALGVPHPGKLRLFGHLKSRKHNNETMKLNCNESFYGILRRPKNVSLPGCLPVPCSFVNGCYLVS